MSKITHLVRTGKLTTICVPVDALPAGGAEIEIGGMWYEFCDSNFVRSDDGWSVSLRNETDSNGLVEIEVEILEQKEFSVRAPLSGLATKNGYQAWVDGPGGES